MGMEAEGEGEGEGSEGEIARKKWRSVGKCMYREVRWEESLLAVHHRDVDHAQLAEACFKEGNREPRKNINNHQFTVTAVS